MIIEAVIVCKDYSDFLEHTLPENLNHVDRLVVVTHPDDKKTQGLCAKYGVEYLETTIFHDDGDKFNKGRAINLGLSHLKHTDWILHIDADILLPHRFRNMLEKAKLNKTHIYGADRLNGVSWDNWTANQHKNIPQFQYKYLVTPTSDFPLGSRLLHNEYGYCPIGYFQLWHSSVKRTYPIVNGSAEHGDVMFSVKWPRENRTLLPEFFVYHLESESGKMGVNWNGRKTKHFPKPHHHHKHHHHHGYCGCEKK